MNVRVILTTAIPALLLAGCGAPQADKFVDGYITKRLHPKAARVVRGETVDHFGSPHSLVLMLELAGNKQSAMRFGRIQGQVLADEDSRKPKDYQIRVKLTGNPSLKPADMKGLALVWQSGAYRNAVYEAPKNISKQGIKKGDEVYADFRVIGFEPSSTEEGAGILSLNFKLESRPKKDDRFILVGHRLRSGRSLYMRHCMHCHGSSGDGNGPTAKYLNPKPRDYRLGIFKFTSTKPGIKPSRADLQRIIKNGVPGTYMPSFLLLADRELKEIIEYVRWLSMRGEFEHKLAMSFVGIELSKAGWSKLKDSGEDPETELKAYIEESLDDKVASTLNGLRTGWAKANSEKPEVAIRPEVKRPVPGDSDYDQSIAKGRKWFLSKTKGNCFVCHGTTARGNGPQTTSFLKNTLPLATTTDYEKPGLYDNWGNPIRPRDLTTGIFRGGRRPIDIYRRIRAGIKGTPMPAMPTTTLSDAEVWDLVNYVLSVRHLENGTMSLPALSAVKTAK